MGIQLLYEELVNTMQLAGYVLHPCRPRGALRGLTLLLMAGAAQLKTSTKIVSQYSETRGCCVNCEQGGIWGQRSLAYVMDKDVAGGKESGWTAKSTYG